MGIPRLIATLEPYAEHGVFRGVQVVIDGPALAYHILNVCRASGISQPSYHVLGEAVIRWLDELEKSESTIQHIYFDGSLPTSKQHVRMERMMKSCSRIEEFFNSNPKGCPLPPPQQAGELEAGQAPAFDVFEAAAPAPRHHPDPAFLVPAVIDAVRSCPRYRDRFSVVPGEADVFCASHVARRGGTVLTSDSDLLAHDLGSGKVVFLREIQRTAEGKLSCLAFTPREIHAKIGLPDSVEPWRFAYERKHSPHATLSRLVSACSRPVKDSVDYDTFCRQYLHRQDAETLPTLVGRGGGVTPLRLNGLDPRLSELVLQLGHHNAADASMFLPVLIENPLRGTVWEPSMSTRRLAYSVASWLTDCPPSLPVYEFRRVRQRSQKGRQLTLVPPDAIAATIKNIVPAIQRSRRKRSAGDADPRHWIILSLLLDVAGCEEQGKTSHLLETLRKGYTPSPTSTRRLPWDIAHFAAQVQAGLYSLRILAQVLDLLPKDCEDAFGGSLWQLRRLLSQFPSLPRFPDAPDIVKLLEPPARQQALEIIMALGSVGEDPSDQKVPYEARKAGKQNGPREESMTGTRPSPTAPGRSMKQNMFSLLDVDQ